MEYIDLDRPTTFKMQSRMAWKLAGIVVMIVVADIIAMGIYFSINGKGSSSPDNSGDEVLSPPPPSNSVMGVYSKAAVVTVGVPCAKIGRQMLDAGGTAVDATIATLLCDGVVGMQSMGVGGGFLMTIYNKTDGKAYSLNARETAPAAATQDMYVNHPLWATLGPMSAGIPGELKGYQEAHQRFGKLPWKDLFLPTIQLCEQGFQVNKKLADNFQENQQLIFDSPTFVNIMLNSTGGRLPKEGELLKLPKLGETLRVIAESPNMADELYRGSLTKGFVHDIQEGGGIITEQDMNDYQVRWDEPFNASLSGGLTVFSAALPGSGLLLTFMLKLLDGLIQYAYSDVERAQMIVEAFKHAYGRRTNLGDPYFMNQTLLQQVVKDLTDYDEIMGVRQKIKLNWTSPDVKYYGADYVGEEHGTHNIIAIGGELAVCVTSTLNTWFGGKFVSRSTGILMNNEMDDFSTPGMPNFWGVWPSEANFIAPGKRPMSSMSPTIVVNQTGDVRLVVGGAGGAYITTQTALAAIRNLWLGHNIKEAVDAPRFHHQLIPMTILYEYGISKYLVDAWHGIGHNTTRLNKPKQLALINGVARLGEQLTASYDWRKPGATQGF